MIQRLAHGLALSIAAVLIVFNLRRLIFTLIALFGQSPVAPASLDSTDGLPPRS